ncbi:MAG TPA: peroxidase family protein [Myxococcota bacterium]|nr:peroxidase family protein [Myxococcota bacterium]
MRRFPFAPSVVLVFALSVASDADAGRDRRSRSNTDVSPTYRIEPNVRADHHDHSGASPGDVRSLDGSGNHLDDPERNAAGTPLLRSVEADYADGVSFPAGAERPAPRAISNAVHAQDDLVPNPLGTSDFLWQWGQFLDHDLDLTEGVDPPEPLPIAVPLGDLHFDPTASGSATIPFNRSIHDPRSGTDRANPREQLNEITGWIDASNVYGSDPERAAALRANDGTGRLATGPGGLLPDDDGTLPNATGGTGETLFVAGDVRANEQLGLIALHTLFVREHNRLADEIRRLDPTLDGDAIYERARRRVGALMQIITYEEFLPALLGRNAIAPYAGYDPAVDARIANEFSTAAFRFGHSALPPRLLRLDSRLREMPEGHVPLRDAFFHPDRIRFEGGIDPILRGLAHQRHQRIDVFVIDDVRNFLFGPPGAGGFDLVSLNIQRGRDHGLARYDDVRVAYGLPRVSRFDEISPDPAIRARLASVYREVDEIDLWVGGLAEDPVPGAHVGPLVRAILIEQFTALRDGDRFWYERALGRRELDRLRGTRLSDVIRRNTAIRGEIPDDVFRVAPRDRRRSSRRHRPASVRAPDRLEFELVMHDPDQD